MKKIRLFCLVMFFFLSSFSTTYADYSNNEHIPASNSSEASDSLVLLSNNASIIENYTWALMRYDHFEPSKNFEIIDIPTPTTGTILIPANMMSKEVCLAALQIQKDSKIETLHALDEYDIECMIHTADAFFKGNDEWHTDASFNFRKESALEMKALGDICFKADLVGECYAQASFNTAVLRLCGFSAEEVFTIGIQGEIGGHAVTIVQVDGEWCVFDSTYAPYVRNGMRDSLIFSKYYRSPITDYIVFIENDKYLINFGTLYPQYVPTLKNPYNNMDLNLLADLMEKICPLFNNSFLGKPNWNISNFIEHASPHPLMKSVAIPFTVEDAIGSHIEEKSDSLALMIKEFIYQQSTDETQHQYDKSCYALGLLTVEYPQVYANAAKLAAWTSKFGSMFDRISVRMDVINTGFWIRASIMNKPISPDDCVAYPDLLYLRHAGSSVDKAVLAYGTLRNMKKDADFWQPDDLLIIITDKNEGFLAVKINGEFKYLNFEKGSMIQSDPPADIYLSFNECNCSRT